MSVKARDYNPAVKYGAKWYPEDLVTGLNPFGDYWYVDYANGNDSNTGNSVSAAFKTLGAAHSAATSNKGDVIFVNGSTGSHIQEASMLTWSKNRISVIGIGPAGAVDPQPEIQLSAAGNAADNAATMKVTGYGNSFTNLYISNAGTHANSVTALWDAGENNVYTNCQFAKFSDLGETGVSNVEARGDTTTWRNCKFGVDWVTVEVARANLLIKGTGGGARMKHNIFEDCYFVVTSDDANYDHIRVYDTNSIAFNNIWKNPIFMSSVITSLSAVQLTVDVDVAAGLAEGSLFFVNPATTAASFCTANTRVLVVANSMADSGDNNVAITMGIGQAPA